MAEVNVLIAFTSLKGLLILFGSSRVADRLPGHANNCDRDTVDHRLYSSLSS